MEARRVYADRGMTGNACGARLPQPGRTISALPFRAGGLGLTHASIREMTAAVIMPAS
jgi:hypothetical protein